MTTSSPDLNKFRVQLEQMRSELQAELTDLQQQSANVDQTVGYGVKNHPAEDASEMFLRERNLAITNGLRQELQEVERALQRIAAGTYGNCEVCGESIMPGRL